ncbi:MAG: hypothetical protein APF77_10900 [Clostridia bacterium BRH_c25]|nr:MAG: hypothetical protein APF77_10900 [Clostridia bacterium BRH_c25]
MRVTNSMMVNNMMRNMTKNLNRMEKTQQYLATGKKFVNPSDDPIGVSRSLRLNTEISNMDQYKRNIEDGLSWLETTETAVGNVGEVLKRAKELVIQGTNETYSGEQRKAIAKEIRQLKEQLISIGNMNYAGSYIFSGFKTDKPLLDSNGDYDLGGGTLGINENINFNVGYGDAIGINFVGQKIFGVGDYTAALNNNSDAASTDPAQLIGVFDQLIADLEVDPDGDTTGINAALDRIEVFLDNTNTVRAEIGVKTNRLELTLQRIEDDIVNLKTLLSNNEDADISEVIMNLKMEENVYRASLAGGARIIMPSLIDFIS